VRSVTARWGDLLAGVSVALVLVPQALAYAQLAGMPPERGLYAAALPLVAAAAIASSPYLQTGPTAITALLTLGALSPLAQEGTARFVELGLLLALVVGVVRLAVGALRLGVVAYLLSQPLLLGFIPAAAILIGASQLPAALGVSPPDDGVFRQAGWALGHPGSWEVASIVLALVTAAVVLGAPRVNRLVPGVLLAAIGGIVFTQLAGYDGPVVGAVDVGLPPVSLELPWGEIHRLLLPGLVIALVGFAEASSIARTFAALERRPWDADREFASQGLANVVAGATGGFPVGGSFSRSALNRLAGARTRLSGAVTGLIVLAFLPFAHVLSDLPRAVLAGIVIAAVAGLVRLVPILRLWRFSIPQFGVAVVTFALTLALAPHIERALLVGIGLAIAVHLWRELALDIDTSTDGDTLHLRPLGVLWFGTARSLEQSFLGLLAAHPDARRLAVHLDGLGRIDLSGALALRSLLEDARRAGLEVDVLDVPPRARRVVERVIEREEDPLTRSR
jgi:SulP family sulfate permease